MIGNIVGNYKIIQALGEGGVGMVYKGVDTMLDREVAIKVLRPELASQTSVVERFRSEAVTLAKLSHPNIATLYSLFRHGSDLFMVLEFIPGETIDHLLYRRGRIPTDEAIPIFCQALEGINYAHERGIVHRDIKPGNMMLMENGMLKVLDFGIARLLGSNRMTRVGNVIGTLEYMSPEQVRGLETDARSDVYGLGIMLYEMLTGKLPFESENDFELMKMQTEQMPHPPRQLNPDIPIEVEAAIMKSVAKDPNDRFQSAGDFLETFLDLGFAFPNTTLGFGSIYNFKKSRPSKPGLTSGEVKNSPLQSNAQSNIETAVLQSGIVTEPILSLSTPDTLEAGEELKKAKLAEPRLGQVESNVVQQNEIKGTRLAGSVVTNPNEIKSTRLGVMENNQVSTDETNEKSSSFFDQLTWVHYAGAGAAVFFLFSAMTFAVALPFMWGGDSPKKEEPKNVPQRNTEPKNVTVTTPTPVAAPQSSPQQNNVEREQVSQPTPYPNPTPGITPIPNDPQPVQNSPKQRQPETVKNSPPPTQKQQPKKTSPPVQREQPPKETGGKRLRDILTGN